MAAAEDEAEVPEQEPPAQADPSGRWTRTNDILGKGAFKTVYKGFDELEGLEVAWNQIRMNELVSTKEDRDRLFAEIRVLKQLKHKNIMTFHDSWLEKQGYTVNFITELFTSGTLRQYRKRHRFLDSEVMKRWAWQILCGLVYLHGHTPPIIHRDLKCDNIFINGSEGVVKIGDLGLATMLRARTAPQSVLGTPEFMAPELYDEEYDDRVDVYSFGMCLLELATLEYPYSECRNAAQIYRKVTLGLKPKALGRVTNRQLADFVCHCIQSRDSRPRSRQLLKHHYFDSIRAERLTLKLGAEALGLPGPKDNETHAELNECAASGGSNSSSVSRTSSAAGEMQQESSYLLDAVPEEDDIASVTSKSIDGGSITPLGGDEIGELQEGRALFADRPDILREFKVKGKLQEDEDKLSLRLRIMQAEKAPKVVEFEFDLGSDTAMSVASEMVEEMSLSHSDAARIAQAIKEEIFSLTHKVMGDQHRAAASYGSVSDDESGPLRRAPSDGLTALSDGTLLESNGMEVKYEVRGGGQLASACSDSVMSVHDVHEDPFSPHHQPVNLALGSELCSRLSADSQGLITPDSSFSLGSSPLQDNPLADAAIPQALPFPGSSSHTVVLSTRSSHALPVGLPPGPSLSRTRSEGVFRRLGRTDSANHAHEMEALQQALNQKGTGLSTGKLLAPLPKEEDRRLPLKKWMESMKELTHEAKPHGPQRVETAPGKLEPSHDGHTHRALSSPSLHGKAVSQPPELRRVSMESSCINGTQAGLLTRPLESSTVTAPATWTSPKRDMQLSSGAVSEGSVTAGNSPTRGKCRVELGAELSQAKEAKRQAMAEAAQNSLKNMESRSLEGLGDFGIGLGSRKQQVPLRNLMGPGKL